MYIVASISPSDLVVLFVIALVVFGPKRLPEVGRQVGYALRDLKKLSQEFTGAFMGIQDQVHESVLPVVSGVSGYVSSVTDGSATSDGMSVPPGSPLGTEVTATPDLMASKTEFGDEQSHRSRRGVTLSTLPPESKGEV